ncbi:uncharacterized protein SPPG_03229 [Spizellomyces punctatus DAOM BR117]|uniref:LSM2-LSM8 complex subunit LSM8 n=1 Tax=Spizellomyces punctatus (strain DAOM BR117) TaxID=645134 RepID=A0A0L0HKR0_SPIPD|nr:uncharacterized protein SPPG_03229 [Spizellomyces punctatus DAOM BR117]KND01424.1 hypothetical protein SPPG_03229 [Spizellomyces punctatus DAOM BR117]|eukprot:XP_016609463.1 hypothetical protein SPPG_03229 [Spizellomyces punctatus DAOM BR117]
MDDPGVRLSLLLYDAVGTVATVANKDIQLTPEFAIQGTLKGFDQITNVILSGSSERVFGDEGVEEVPLGLYIIRGHNVAAIGQVDTETDETIDWPRVKAQPLRAIKGGAGVY